MPLQQQQWHIPPIPVAVAMHDRSINQSRDRIFYYNRHDGGGVPYFGNWTLMRCTTVRFIPVGPCRTTYICNEVGSNGDGLEANCRTNDLHDS